MPWTDRFGSIENACGFHAKAPEPGNIVPMFDRESEYKSDSGKTRTQWLYVILYSTLLLLFLLIAGASFHRDKPLWGINHLAFYPLSVRIIALSLMALSFIPAISRKSYAFLLKSINNLRARASLLKWFMIIVPIFSLAVFIYFRSSTLLLGDGHLIASNFEHTFEGHAGMITRDIHSILIWEGVAKGATMLYSIAAKVSVELFHSTPIMGIKIFNCLLGAVFIYILLRIMLLSSLSNRLRVWMAFLVLSSGIMELFFGYVENYTPLIFCGFLYLISGFFFIHRLRVHWIIITFLFLIMSIFTHVMAMLLVPSFVLLLGYFIAGRSGKALMRYLSPVLIVLILIAWNIYRTFRFSRWLDIANELLILMPIFPICAVLAIVLLGSLGISFRYGRDKAAPKNQRSALAAGNSTINLFSTEAEWHFVLQILAPSLLFLIAFRPVLGMPRDWDLFTFAFLGLLPFSLLVLNRFHELVRQREISMITIPALVMSVCIGMAWIGINADHARAENRFKQILEYDNTNQAYAYEILADHYYEDHRLDEAIEAIKKAAIVSHTPRTYILLSKYYEERGRTDEAVDVLYYIIREWYNPKYTKWARTKLASLLYATGQYDKLLEVARDGVRHHPEQPAFHFYLAKMLLEEDLFKEAAGEFQRCKSLDPPPLILEQIDDIIDTLRQEGKL